MLGTNYREITRYLRFHGDHQHDSMGRLPCLTQLSRRSAGEVHGHLPYTASGSAGVPRRIRLLGQERDSESPGGAERGKQL